MLFSYWHFQKVFTDVVLLSVLTAVIPYLYSAAAHLYWLLVKGRAVSWPHLVRDLVVTTVALAVHVLGARRHRLPGRVLRDLRVLPRRSRVHLDEGAARRVRRVAGHPDRLPSDSPYAIGGNGNGNGNGAGVAAAITLDITVDPLPHVTGN